jgi:hypothetical protein
MSPSSFDAFNAGCTMSGASPVWFFRRDDRQVGPLTWGELTALCAASEVTANDEVSQSDGDWTAAGLIRGLTFGAPRAVPSLNYEAPRASPTIISGYACEVLGQTAPFVRIIAVVLFIIAGLLVAGALLMGGIAATSGHTVAIAGAFLYLAMTALYIFPGIFLLRYAANASAFARRRDTRLLEKAIEAQKSFWKFAAVAVLIVVAIYLFMAVVAGAAGMLLR